MNNLKSPIEQTGIALIQVLLLSVMLSVLMISVVFNSKAQLIEAAKIQQRSDAMVMLHSHESELLFSLLTHDRRIKADSPLELPRYWNFYGSPVAMPGWEVQIHDVSGFFSIYNLKQVKYLLELYGAKPPLLQKTMQDLRLLVLPKADIPEFMQRYIQSAEPLLKRSSGIQMVDELRFIEGIDDALFKKISPYLSSYPIKNVNPAAMSPEQMALYVGEPTLSVVLGLRDEGRLTAENFTRLTGLEIEDGYSVTPGNTLELRFTAVMNDVKLSRKLTVVINPYETVPFYFWEYQKYNHAN